MLMTAPTAPSPGLGEREAVARIVDPYAWECWEEIREPHYGSYGLSGEPEGRLEDSTCARWQHAVRGAGMLAKSLAKADAIIAQHIAPLRTENETLRGERDELARAFKGSCESRERLAGRIVTAEAERDAAIARAEAVERENIRLKAKARAANAGREKTEREGRIQKGFAQAARECIAKSRADEVGLVARLEAELASARIRAEAHNEIPE